MIKSSKRWIQIPKFGKFSELHHLQFWYLCWFCSRQIGSFPGFHTFYIVIDQFQVDFGQITEGSLGYSSPSWQNFQSYGSAPKMADGAAAAAFFFQLPTMILTLNWAQFEEKPQNRLCNSVPCRSGVLRTQIELRWLWYSIFSGRRRNFRRHF